MKAVSESLGSVGLRRILLPGMVLTAGAHPYLARLIDPCSNTFFPLTSPVLLAAEVAFFGMAISSFTTPIFFLYEGFLFARLFRRLTARRNAKVLRWQEKLRDHRLAGAFEKLSREDQADIGRLTLRLLDYPNAPSEDGISWFAESPTKLGNIIASYELYPESRYGVDGELFWNHLLYLAPEPARKDFHDKSELAESLVLSSAAAFIVSAIATGFLLARLFGSMFPKLSVGAATVPDPVGYALLAGGLAAGPVFYLMAIPAQREVARSFRALTDLAIPAFEEMVLAEDLPLDRSLEPRARDIGRYLRFLKKPGPTTAPAEERPRSFLSHLIVAAILALRALFKGR